MFNSAIFDETKPQVPEPIVQCVQIKTLPSPPNQPERYRAVFSDIANYVQTMIATRTCFPLITLSSSSDLLTARRSHWGGEGWVSSEGLFRATHVISVKCCQRKEVCDAILSILTVLIITVSSSSWALKF